MNGMRIDQLSLFVQHARVFLKCWSFFCHSIPRRTLSLQQHKDKKAIVPSTIGDELEFNPFMRVDKESLQVTGFSQYFPAELLWSALSLEKN
jgi:hypothetical protein